METIHAILAQSTPVDVIGGASGWVGTGLLGAVLSWLMFVHLPAKDKQAKELADTHSQRLDTLGAYHVKAVETVIAGQEVQLNRILDHCRTELESVVRGVTPRKGQ